MSCEPNFPDEIPFDCALEIVRAISSGGVPGDGSLAVKGLWVAGSLIKKFGPPADSVTLSVDDVESCERNLAYAESVASIPPAVWMMLLNILLKWLEGKLSK